MSMITELVERLKDLYVDAELDMLCGVDGECRQAIKESAQVIEELSAKLQAANMERSSRYYNGGWIPCSERLPKAGEYIGDGDVAKYYLVQNEYGDMLVARYTYSGYWEQIYQLKPIEDKIVAWRELPEQYVTDINVGDKTESEDKE